MWEMRQKTGPEWRYITRTHPAFSGFEDGGRGIMSQRSQVAFRFRNRQGMAFFPEFLGKKAALLITCVTACVCVHRHMCAHMLSHVWLFSTSETVAHQVPLSMGFSSQDYCSVLPFPPGNLPNPGIEPVSPVSLALASGFFTTEPPGNPDDTQFS